MFSLKIVSRRDKDNLVMIRATNMRKVAYLTLGIYMTPEELDNALSPIPASYLTGRSRLLKGYQIKIDQAKTQLVLDGKTGASPAEIISVLKERIFGEEHVKREAEKQEQARMQSQLFAPFFRNYMEKCVNDGYRATFEYTYKMLEKLVDEQKFAKMKFEDVNLKWLYWLESTMQEKEYSRNTIASHFRNIRTVINRAIDEELTTNYPFRRFKIETEQTRKRSLPVQELRKLFSMEVEPHQNFYRDMFKLIFMLCGINAVDLFNLKEITKEGRIEYRRAKTKKLYSIKVEPEALEIINKYKGMKNLLSPADRWESHKEFTKWMNITLKKIGTVQRVGRGGKKEVTSYWPDLSTYWARHTWATIAHTLDIPKDIISRALGHEIGSAITEIYIDPDIEKVDKANRKVLDWVLYGIRDYDDKLEKQRDKRREQQREEMRKKQRGTD